MKPSVLCMLSGLLVSQAVVTGCHLHDGKGKVVRRVEGDMWCPQIKDVTHVSRRRPGVSGRVVINDKPGEAGEEIHPGCQAANGPDGENPIEQVEQLASRTDSRSCVRA
jgi:hypothetical protein